MWYKNPQSQIHIPESPRIISLVPSQTELLFDLGLEVEVVGITKFCVHPRAWFETKKRVGGTKTVDLAKIHALKPDLIIANKEENVQEQIAELAKDYPVWVTDVQNLDAALGMIEDLGKITGKSQKAKEIADQIKHAFQKLTLKSAIPKRRVAYFIWRKPWMAAGGDTFIHDMLLRCGWENVFADQTRYPELNASDIANAEPDLILLSSEPYPFAAKHIQSLSEICPRAEIKLVDGEMFSWYGSRLQYAPDYFLTIK